MMSEYHPAPSNLTVGTKIKHRATKQHAIVVAVDEKGASVKATVIPSNIATPVRVPWHLLASNWRFAD